MKKVEKTKLNYFIYIFFKGFLFNIFLLAHLFQYSNFIDIIKRDECIQRW